MKEKRLDRVSLEYVRKDIKKVPRYIKLHLIEWAEAVELVGIREMRRVSGYHDEPLKGKRKGQRSIRLSRSYRAIYIEENNGDINIISVKEVNKHEY